MKGANMEGRTTLTLKLSLRDHRLLKSLLSLKGVSIQDYLEGLVIKEIKVLQGEK